MSLARRPHESVPGLQTPVQELTPLVVVHTEGHVELVHWPVASQVCSVLPEHCVVPGVQTPVHLPALHTNWQACPSVHLPDLQVCGVLLLHCVLPSVHEPAQAP